MRKYLKKGIYFFILFYSLLKNKNKVIQFNLVLQPYAHKPCCPCICHRHFVQALHVQECKLQLNTCELISTTLMPCTKKRQFFNHFFLCFESSFKKISVIKFMLSLPFEGEYKRVTTRVSQLLVRNLKLQDFSTCIYLHFYFWQLIYNTFKGIQKFDACFYYLSTPTSSII